MPPRPEFSRRRLAGRGIFAALVLLAAMPIYLSLSASWRSTAVRLACAAVVVGGCLRVLRWLRPAAEARPISAIDAPPPPPPALALDARFAALRDDLVSSVRSRRYFDVILWPRLSELAAGDLPLPARRRGLLARRGPSLATIERLVAEVERRA